MRRSIKFIWITSCVLSVLSAVLWCFASKDDVSQSTFPEWHMVNVNQSGQGDAHLLIDNKINTLIDAGSAVQGALYLVPYLQDRGISVIHHLFVSHPHTDHYGGINALADSGILVENIYYNLPPLNTDDWDYKRHEFLATIKRYSSSKTNIQDVSKGFSVDLPESSFKVMHAQKTRTINGQRVDVNDYSLIIQWDVKEFRALFTGDLNLRLGSELAKLRHLKADLLKIPHHGVTGIAPNSFFNTVAPKFAMSPSTKKLWRHPRGSQSRAWLEYHKLGHCHNGLNGNIVLTFSERISVRSERSSPSCRNGVLDIEPGDKIEESFIEKRKNTLDLTSVLFLIL